jgi:hypothetical protein
MNPFLAAALPLSTLLAIGGVAALVIVAWSFSNWRAAVKIAFIAVLIEGAIRKWILPGGQELVYFMKDIFLVGAYLKFYLAPDAELRAYRLRVPGTLILLLAAIVCFSALNPNIGSAMLAVYGVKIYFMYLPLVFMMPFLFRNEKEMVRQLTWYALLAIPICLLGVLQFKSDRFSVMNTFAAGMDEETGATGFGFGDRARITGTFSYLTGHTTFVIFFATLHIALLSLKETKWKWILLFVSLPLLAGNALMGGARASIITMAFVIIGYIVASMSGKVGSSKNFVAVLLVSIVVAMVGMAFVFTEALMNWSARAQFSGDGLKSRVVEHPMYALSKAFEEGGMLGYGMGTAHPATDAIRKKLKMATIKNKVPVYDNELGQVLVELGLLGFLSWYGLRLMLFVMAINSFWRSPPGSVRSLCLAGVLITGPFLLMSVVFNHTANFFIFALAGFALIPLVEPVVTRRAARDKTAANPRLEEAPLPGRARL